MTNLAQISVFCTSDSRTTWISYIRKDCCVSVIRVIAICNNFHSLNPTSSYLQKNSLLNPKLAATGEKKNLILLKL